jgi:type II secretion system protein I
MTPRPRIQRASPGFSLVEILVALSIMALVVIGLIRAFDVSLAWTARSNDQTVAINLAQQRIEQVKAWVEGSPDQLVRAQRFLSLAAPPWREPRTSLPGELSRFDRETVIEDVGSQQATQQGWPNAKIVRVRIYPIRSATTMAELTTVVAEQP